MQFYDKITAYLDQELSPDEKRRFEEELAVNEDLKTAVEAQDKIRQSLQDAFAAELVAKENGPSAETSEQESSSFTGTEREYKKNLSFPDLQRTRRMWPFFISAAAACIVFGFVLIETEFLHYPRGTDPTGHSYGSAEVSLPPPPPPSQDIGNATVEAPGDTAVATASRVRHPAMKMEMRHDLAANRTLDGASGRHFPAAEVSYLSALPAEMNAPEPAHPFNTEEYDSMEAGNFKNPLNTPLSTFSIDVDTASYANVRRFLEGGSLPPEGAVRIEELVNYFNYSYGPPSSPEKPFAVYLDTATAPWNPGHSLVRVALQGYRIPWEERPQSNLVFLVDVSGSMRNENKLPLVKKSLSHLVQRLDERDRVAIVTYAGQSRVALPSTTANNHETLNHALTRLVAGGSTQGSSGIRMAYEIARKHFLKEGNNRVILCTDGDFNVGVTNRSELTEIIKSEAESGIFLSIFCFGMGNYKDATLEELSNKGNGNYGYIDTEREARKVFVEGAAGTLLPIAKDVKIQIEFNPAAVKAYRLIGYENRALQAEDFNDDRKDAGEIGAGHSVTAFYEVIPAGLDSDLPDVDELKYQKSQTRTENSDEMLTLKIRYKDPKESESKLLSRVLANERKDFAAMDKDFRFATTVALFGMRLRNDPHVPGITWDDLIKMGHDALATQPDSYRTEFLQLVEKAKELSPSLDEDS